MESTFLKMKSQTKKGARMTGLEPEISCLLELLGEWPVLRRGKNTK